MFLHFGEMSDHLITVRSINPKYDDHLHNHSRENLKIYI